MYSIRCYSENICMTRGCLAPKDRLNIFCHTQQMWCYNEFNPTTPKQSRSFQFLTQQMPLLIKKMKEQSDTKLKL